jgi:ABC-type transport system substrate-binding protein
MNTTKRLMTIFSILIMLSFILSACTTPGQTIIQTVEVEKIKEVEKVVTQEVIKEVEKEVQVNVPVSAATAPFALGDLKVRQAMAYCTNKLDLVRSVYPLASAEEQEALVMHTMISREHWAYAGDENITIYPFDPEKGKALLDEAGWTLSGEEEYRSNADGIELALKFTTTAAAFRQTWAAVFEQQMKECGIRIVRLHAPASWWFGDTTGLARRDFELGAFAWVGQVDPGGQTLWACDQIPGPDNGWEGQNNMGWCSEKATIGIKRANNTLIKDERIAAYTDVQQAYTEDLPALPLFNRTETFSVRADLTGFAPRPGEEYYVYNAHEWEVPGEDTIIIGFTQEPASLFGLVEDAFVAHVILTLLGMERSYTTLDYDFQPVFLTEMPSIEKGTAQNNDVEVSAGTEVIDADGDIVVLEPGVKVVNAAGDIVEFTGGTVTMKQLVVTYEYRSDLRWSDGEPVKQADLELAYKIDCDRDSGATSYITCNKIQSMEFDGLKTIQTMKPGDQFPLYFSRDFRFYPSHRVIASGPHAGKTLAEVPAQDWATLAEIAEKPLGIGAYMVVDWVKGEKIVLAANPYYFGGAPKTPNMIISIVSAENAEAQLLGGQVDVLGSETLSGITETLNNAENAGRVNNYIIPGGTWEHIDINLGFAD